MDIKSLQSIHVGDYIQYKDNHGCFSSDGPNAKYKVLWVSKDPTDLFLIVFARNNGTTTVGRINKYYGINIAGVNDDTKCNAILHVSSLGMWELVPPDKNEDDGFIIL